MKKKNNPKALTAYIIKTHKKNVRKNVKIKDAHSRLYVQSLPMSTFNIQIIHSMGIKNYLIAQKS